MIGVQEAKALVAAHARCLGSEKIGLEKLYGRVLARAVRAPFCLPRFDQSAMDGFAFASREAQSATQVEPALLPLNGECKAGDPPLRLSQGHASRIMTGASLPAGADTVLPKERAILKDGSLVIAAPVSAGQHVRRRGEEVSRGETVIPKHAVLRGGGVAVLASLGLTTAEVFRQPRVAIIATGSELVDPGEACAGGGIYDSNSWMLQTLLLAAGVEARSRETVVDRPELIREALERQLERQDVIILSGGMSVGDHDYAEDVLERAGARILFHGVRQKPGKPMLLARKGKALIFGLPGNPAAAFVCFYVYVYDALRRMMGCHPSCLPLERVVMRERMVGDRDRDSFQRLRLEPRGPVTAAELLPHQGSHMISQLWRTNALLALPAGRRLGIGDEAWVHRLPEGGWP